MRCGLGLAQAFRTMTIIPVPGKDAKKASTQLHFYPLVGLTIGAIGVSLLYLCSNLVSISTGVCMVLGALWAAYMAFITRGFHLDGLADTADGFGGGWTRERRLEIMKDSRSGSFGVVAISLCLLLKAASAANLILRGRVLLLVWVTFLSRVQVVLMCSFSKYAKESGLSYDLVSGAGASHALSALVQTSLVGCALHVLFEVPIYGLAMPLAASALSMAILALVSKRKIGGVTGDVLGCCCEICETMALAFSVFMN